MSPNSQAIKASKTTNNNQMSEHIMQFVNRFLQTLMNLFGFDMNRETKPSQIDEHLYLGCIKSALDSRSLKSIGIKRILTLDVKQLEAVTPGHKNNEFDYLFIKANDHPYEDLLSKFDECLGFIDEGIVRGDKVLVHCVAGVSRSATIVIAYKMLKNLWSFQEAFDYVKSRRNIIGPNFGFRDQLRLFERMGRKVNSLNKEFRGFLLKNLKHKIVFNRPWYRSFNRSINSSQSTDDRPICQPLNEYFKKLNDFIPVINSDKKHQNIYKCKKCRLFLFSQINVLNTNPVKSGSEVCNNLFIEPIQLMLPHINNQEMGPINCSNCFTKIGNFDWNQICCACDLHKDLSYLIFKIDAKKVDSHYL